MVIFLSELNGLSLISTDIGNAYLEAITQEKVYIKEGPEFSALEGRNMLIKDHYMVSAVVVYDGMKYFPTVLEI